MTMYLHILFVLVIYITTIYSKTPPLQIIHNLDVERKVDLTTHLVKISTDITFVNNDNSAVRGYLYTVPPINFKHLAFIGAKVQDGSNTKLTVNQVQSGENQDEAVYNIALPSPASPGKTVKLTVETIYTHSLRPFPVQILQSEKQYLVYEDVLYFYSPYPSNKQTITLQTATSTIESYTKTKPTSLRENFITYGPYTNVAAYSTGSVRVHYENNSPFLTVTNLERILEISHWGNIAVEEHIDVSHSGAILKGPFSRYHYQRGQDGVSSVKSYKTILPASAHDVYYRDEIGNISTSNMREHDDYVEVELRPRFPLFGGWKTHYYLGYNVPSYEYIYNRGNEYILMMRFVDHVFDDQVIDKAVVKVILPEGSCVVEVKTPYSVKRGADQVHKTYLDTKGRPVIVLSKEQLVEQHIQDFEVHYRFHKWMLLQEPLLVVAAFYLLCIIVIIYVRLDFSITKDEAKESRMRMASLLDDVRAIQDKRSALHQSYDDALKKYKVNKDSSSFKVSLKKIDADYRSLTQQVDEIASKLKGQAGDVADKLAELQRLEGQYKEQVTLAVQYVEKAVTGKMNRTVFEENESSVMTKREDISGKIDLLLENL